MSRASPCPCGHPWSWHDRAGCLWYRPVCACQTPRPPLKEAGPAVAGTAAAVRWESRAEGSLWDALWWGGWYTAPELAAEDRPEPAALAAAMVARGASLAIEGDPGSPTWRVRRTDRPCRPRDIPAVPPPRDWHRDAAAMRAAAAARAREPEVEPAKAAHPAPHNLELFE